MRTRSFLAALILAAPATAVAAVANLSITVNAPAIVPTYSQVVFTIIVHNSGPDSASDVTVQFSPSSNVLFSSSSQGACSLNRTCNIGTLPSGASATIDIYQATPMSPGTVSNTATVTSSTPDPDPADNTAAATTTASGGDIFVSVTGPASAAAGSNITYTIIVSNAGPVVAADVEIVDTLTGGSCIPAGCLSSLYGLSHLGSLAAGGSKSLSVVVAPSTSNLSVSYSVTVSAATADPNPSNNTSTATTRLRSPDNADVSLIASGPASAIAGSNITYTIMVMNAGPSQSSATTVTDTLPAGTALVSATSSQASCSGSSAITCPLGTLASGAVATITLVLSAPFAVVSLSNTATVSATTTTRTRVITHPLSLQT